ncbi:DNA-directed RNA polymerase, subunit 2 [Corchorus capsularis]|uniref:DNA-directed RNA polymerase, subunit 2 n=1 Tax=Corchorus capsularis TaxID=210143 RepID=A0A1R3ISH1_COCAP|nr:DNA-directed RNA polymerase, subunit 2 [Corchorus capsularis]
MTSMDLDDDDIFDEPFDMREIGEGYLKSFCRQTVVAFFNQYGLISHQIYSYNDFIRYGLQRTFDSFGEYEIQPGYDPSKKGDSDWRHAKVKFGKVSVERPTC